MKRARAGSLHCLAFGAVSCYNVLAVHIAVSAAAELIINAGKEGDSVLQILEKICKNNNIEVKKTEDGLIEAIGYLKNGDCGEGSCWVYTVDGKLMSDNPADCKVKGGEDIVWTFTLNGGNDIENV